MGRWSSDAFLRYWRHLDIIVLLHAENLPSGTHDFFAKLGRSVNAESRRQAHAKTLPICDSLGLGPARRKSRGSWEEAGIIHVSCRPSRCLGFLFPFLFLLVHMVIACFANVSIYPHVLSPALLGVCLSRGFVNAFGGFAVGVHFRSPSGTLGSGCFEQPTRSERNRASPLPKWQTESTRRVRLGVEYRSIFDFLIYLLQPLTTL